MDDIKWKLKNVKTGAYVDISKSIFKIGRNASADLVSLNVALSRNHATLSVLIDGCLYVLDNKSSNGTFVNKHKISTNEMKLLKHGDIIEFGYCEKASTDENTDPSLMYEVLKNAPDIPDIKDLNISKSSPEQQIDEIGTSKNNDGFSIDSNDCIVISDGEDDENPFSSSQIFKLSETIKIEQTSVNESIDPYAHIKQELEDLDSCHNVQNVDLTEDQDSFHSTSELINILESSVNKVQDKILEQCSSSSSGSHKPKFIKPPIIEPHFHATSANKPNKKENNRVEKNDTKRKSASKRKNSDAIPEGKKKKVSGSNCIGTNSDKKSIVQEFKKRNGIKNASPPKKVVDRDVKKMIALERKKKLKKISEKDNSKSCKPSVKSDVPTSRTSEKDIYKSCEPIGKTNVSTSKIKISNGRGCFLLEGATTTTSTSKENTNFNKFSAPFISKCWPNDVQHSFTSKSKNCIEKDSHAKKNAADEKVQDTTISSNCSPNSDNNKFKLPETSTTATRIPNGQGPDSTSHEDRSGFIWQVTSSHPKPAINNFNKIIPNIDDEICRIVHWSVKWLREQNNCDMSPPVNGERQPMKMLLSFNRFLEYYNTVIPLIMLELWQYVYQTLYNKDEERTPIRVFLNHKRIVGTLTYLDCECYISQEEIRGNNVFRPDDFALIELKLKDSANGLYIYTGFGYIKFCKRINLKDDMIINNDIAKLCPGIPCAILRFSFIMRNLQDKDIIGKQIIVKVIANIASSLRLLKTVKVLETSPLLKRVLSPDIKDYKSSSVEKNLVIEINLNNQQKKIVFEACDLCSRNVPGIYLIKGPPGTGKSTVIVNIVLQILLSSDGNGRKPPLILLTAPSNAAVDGLVLKLAEARLKLSESQKRHLKLVRIGPDSSISKSVSKFKLSNLAQNHILKEKGLITLEEYNNALRMGDKREEFLRKHLGYNYFYEMKCAEEVLLFGSNIICTTLNSCISSRIMESVRRDQLKFSCCIIDEATQCSEAESLHPIQLGIDKLILVGDPQQLPAVVCNRDAQKLGYGKSLFARIDDNFKEHPESPIKMLYEQYRMNSEICEYPNKTFYDGKLISFPIHTNRIVPELKPYLLFNLINTGNEDNSPYENSEEVQLIYNLLDTLRRCIQSKYNYSIGVITPYRAQKELLIRRISDLRFHSNVSITVNTVDSFQGMQNDIVIISCVRYTSNYFLQNDQRLNVALTRARQALYVIGNYLLFKHCRPLYDLREDAKKRKLCIDLNDNPRNINYLHKFIIQR